jgi:ABC-2 type transport system permease protein
MFVLLLRHRFRLWRNALWRGRGPGGRIAGGIGIAVLAAFVLLFVTGNTYLVTSALLDRDPGQARASLTAIVAAAMLFVLFSEVGLIIHHLYLASDLDLLLAAPVPLRSLFLLKLTESSLLGGLAWPVQVAALTGYGLAMELPWSWYALAVVVSAGVVILGTAVSMTAVMLVMRVLPTGRVRSFLTLGGALLGAGLWLLFQIASRGAGRDAADRIGPAVSRFSDRAGWSPASWAANILLAVQDGDPAALAANAALFVTLGAIAIVAASTVFRYTFYVSRGRAQESAPRRPTVRPIGRERAPARIVPASVLAVLMKDWRSLRRDMRLLSGFIYPLVMVGFFAVSTARSSGNDGDRFWRAIVTVPLVPFLLSTSVVLTSFGREGAQFALLRASPLRMRDLIAGKFLAGFLPILGVTGLVVVVLALWRGAAPGQLVAAMGMAVWLTAGEVLACIAASAAAPRFNADNPQKSTGLLGNVLGFVLGLLFTGASGGLFAWWVLLAIGDVDAGPRGVVMLTAVLAAVVLLVLLVITAVLAAGIRRLQAWEAT